MENSENSKTLQAQLSAAQDKIATLEKILSHREQQYSTLIENSKAVIFSWKFQGLWPVKLVSENISQFGYKAEDFSSGKINFISIIHLDDRERALREAENNIAKKLFSYEQEYRIITKSGAVRWVLDHTFVKIENTEKYHEGVIIDITEQKLMQEKLMQSEANLSALVENSTDAAFFVNMQCQLIVFNTVFEQRIKSLTGKNLIQGMPIDDLFHKDKDRKLWKQFFARAFSGKKFTERYKRQINKKCCYFKVFFTPILKKQSAPPSSSMQGVIVFLKDITKYKEDEKTLRKQNRELEKINFELDKFVYSASHDLKAPLRSILGVLHLAQNECKSPQQMEYMGMIKKSIHKLDDFIADLINYSRNSRLPIEKQKIDFNQLLTDILEDLKYLDPELYRDVKTDYNQFAPFYSDPRRVSIILHNLLANAIKYQRRDQAEEPFLDIDIKSGTKKIIITIKDNGIGITQEYQKKVFDMFFRATDKSEGSGLGLYIVKQTVKKLKGKIQLESVLGKGTTVTVTLPNHAPKQ